MTISRPVPHDFTLRQLQYAVAVAEALSFRKAAALCHVSQPSLSAQIAELERTLGVQLFERDRSHVLVTQVGETLLARARKLLIEADDLALAAESAGDPLSGTLRIGVIPTISPYLLPSVAPALRAKFPRLTTLWVEDKTASLVRSLEEGSLDAAVLALEAEIGDLEHAIIATDPFVLATRRGDPLGSGKGPATLSELRHAQVLVLEDGHCFRDQALTYCARARADDLEFRATSLSTLAQLVAGGLGVTLLPKIAVATEAKRAGLKVRPLVNPTPHRTIALVWRKRSSRVEVLKQVGSELRRAYP